MNTTTTTTTVELPALRIALFGLNDEAVAVVADLIAQAGYSRLDDCDSGMLPDVVVLGPDNPAAVLPDHWLASPRLEYTSEPVAVTADTGRIGPGATAREFVLECLCSAKKGKASGRPLNHSTVIASILREYDSLPILFVLEDEHGICFCSANAQEFLGVSASEVESGRHRLEHFLNKADRQLFENSNTEQSLQHTGLWVHQLKIQQPDGEMVEAQFTSMRVEDEARRLRHRLISVIKKPVAQAITETNVALYEQQQNLQKMQAIGQLTSGVAHEFNNMLAVMLGNLHLLRMKAARQDFQNVEKYLETLENEGRRAAELISQMLTFSRSRDTNRKRLKTVQAIENTVAYARSMLPTTLAIHFRAALAVPDIQFNEDELKQIILNLLLNAKDALDEKGTVTISVDHLGSYLGKCSACAEGLHGEYVRLVIEDNGPGVRQSDRDKIFEPFFSTKEVGKGTGLGLSIVHNLLSAAGCHLVLAEPASSGARFEIYFPVGGAECEAADERLPSLSADAFMPLAGSVMIVDDDEVICSFLEELLQEWGLDVCSENTASAALSKIVADPTMFDLLITDFTMPHKTGLELLSEIRAVHPLLPVIVCSGRFEKAQKDAIEDESTFTLEKPIDIPRLYAILADQL